MPTLIGPVPLAWPVPAGASAAWLREVRVLGRCLPRPFATRLRARPRIVTTARIVFFMNLSAPRGSSGARSAEPSPPRLFVHAASVAEASFRASVPSMNRPVTFALPRSIDWAEASGARLRGAATGRSQIASHHAAPGARHLGRVPGGLMTRVPTP